MPPLPAGEGSGPDMTVPTNSEIQVAGLEPGADTVTTGTGEGNPSTGGPGSVGGTFEQTYGNGPQFGGMGGQGGRSGFGGPNGPGGNSARSTLRRSGRHHVRPGGPGGGPGGPGGPGRPNGPGKPPSDPPGDKPRCTVNCEIGDPPSNGRARC